MIKRYDPKVTTYSLNAESRPADQPKMLEIASVPDTHLMQIRFVDKKKGFGWGYTGCFRPPEWKNVDAYKIVLGGSEARYVEFERPDFAFNRICDADSNEKTLGYAKKILEDNNIPVLNNPAAVLGTKRDLVYERFNGLEGLHIPKTIRIAPRYCRDVRQFIEDGGIQLPCIFRPTGSHNQKDMTLLQRLDDTDELERFAFDGRDYYMIEFIDYQDADDLYRKLRVVYVDGKLYPRHFIRGSHWMVGVTSMEISEPAMAEEKDFLDNFEDRLGDRSVENLKAFCSKVGLDFFGIDLNPRPDGTLVIFEANACMDIFGDSGKRPYTKQFTATILNAVNQLVIDFSKRISSKAH